MSETSKMTVEKVCERLRQFGHWMDSNEIHLRTAASDYVESLAAENSRLRELLKQSLGYVVLSRNSRGVPDFAAATLIESIRTALAEVEQGEKRGNDE